MENSDRLDGGGGDDDEEVVVEGRGRGRVKSQRRDWSQVVSDWS